MPSPLRRFLLLLTTLCAFVLSMFAGQGEAAAAPIGMCAETAQSIAAPPPMFLADKTAIEACADEDLPEFQFQGPGAPVERVSSSVDSPEQQAVLTLLPSAFRAKTFTVPLSRRTVELPDEHKRRGLRPPQA